MIGLEPVEFSILLYHFIQASAGNYINVEVIRKKNVRLDLKFQTNTMLLQGTERFAMVLDEELTRRKNFTNPV